jgi:hypothetical protein
MTDNPLHSNNPEYYKIFGTPEEVELWENRSYWIFQNGKLVEACGVEEKGEKDK